MQIEYRVKRASRSWVRLRALLAFCASAILLFLTTRPACGQLQIKPHNPGEPVTLLPSDMAILEETTERKDLTCQVTPRKAELGFDLRFHAGYDVTIPLEELAGDEDVLTIIFRVYPDGDKDHTSFFSQHIRVPKIEDDAKGDVMLSGQFNIGEGKYHTDWLLRDRQERLCSSSWDTTAELLPKDKDMVLFIRPKIVEESQFEPFVEEPVIRRDPAIPDPLNVKLLVNFAPQSKDAAALPAVDLAALVSILKTIEHDSRVAHVSLIAFNMQERRVLYRQEAAEQINFPALGKALDSLKLGTVAVHTLEVKHGDTDFLGSLIEKEVSSNGHPDAVIFAGPKAMLDADVPQDDLRSIGDIECPVFYLNYNPNPQAVPWKDSISHAVKFFRGTEYTISKPRDLWFATSEMLSRVARSKKLRAEAMLPASGSR